MLPLKKGPKPEILKQMETSWTAEFLAALKAGETPSHAMRHRYRHPTIKSALRSETSDKCAYCESKIVHLYPGDIEHIAPVSKFPEKYCEWKNLTYACAQCNRRKLDYWSDTEPLLNPYVEDPAEHLIFCGGFVIQRPGSNKGLLTHEKLELSRMALVERRQEKLRALATLLDRWALLPNGNLRDVVWLQIERETSPSTEYSATMQAHLAQCVRASSGALPIGTETDNPPPTP